MNSKIILDTHILIWTLIEPENLKNEVKDIINNAQNSNNLYISAITLWEIAMLIQRKKISVYERNAEFLNSISSIEGLNIININANIAVESVNLPNNFNSDPADCIIIASTREIAGTLVTRDRKIIDWATNGYLKIIEG